ncbi:MAG: putative porin [Nitrospirae bacterium]|nr:putative porin [Nitrospirota bacterium]
MSRITTAVLAGLMLMMSAVPGFCDEGGMTLYQDSETGQLFTKPADGRVAVDPVSDLKLPETALGALYEDEEGAVFSKPGEGRTLVAMASSAEPAAPEPLNKDEVTSLLPEWVQQTKIGGDLRLRYQYEDRHKNTTSHPRQRARFRARLGIESKPLKTVKLNLGFASGNSDDNRSTNQTFDKNFSKRALWIDYAYATFTPNDYIQLVGGRMKNQIWTVKDMVWDSDINPEGGAVILTYPNSSRFEPFMNSVLYVLDERSGASQLSTRDPFMYAFQPGVNIDFSPDMKAKVAGIYYGFDSNRGTAPLAHSAGTNTLKGGLLKYDYASVGATAQVDIKYPIPGLDFLHYAGIYGDYINNLEVSTLGSGWMAGIKLGEEKVKESGQWQFAYNYRSLGRDAFLDSYPDSDAMGGATNIRASEFELAYGLMKNVTLNLDYYMTRDITTNLDEDLFQADVNFTF